MSAVRAESTGDIIAPATPPPTRGILVPLRIDAGISVLQIGAGDGSLTQSLAEQDTQVTTLEPNAEIAQLVGERSVSQDNVHIVGMSLDGWLETTDPSDTQFDLVIYQEHERSETAGTCTEDAVRAAAALLRPTGALVLAVDQPWGLSRLLGSFSATKGLGAAGLRRLLNDNGFPVQRWLLPYPDHRETEIVVAAELLAEPFGASLAKALVRHPMPTAGDRPPATDPVTAFQGAVDAGLAAEIADSFLVIATRGRWLDSSIGREGRLWVVPDPAFLADYRRPRELVEVNGRWLLHPLSSHRPISGGPLHMDPVTVAVAEGRNGEDLVVEAISNHGPLARPTSKVLSAWWQAASSVIDRSEFERIPLDVRPSRFIVNASGDWSFLATETTIRFGMPPEVLAFDAMLRTVADAILARTWLDGMEPSMTYADAARELLRAAGVDCREEHVYLWQHISADLDARMRGPGADRRALIQTYRELAQTTLGSRLASLPLDVRLQAAEREPEAAAEVRRLRGDLASVANSREELQDRSEQLDREVHELQQQRTDLARDLEGARNRSRQLELELAATQGGVDAVTVLLGDLAASEEAFEAAQHRDQPWLAAADLVRHQEGIPALGIPERADQGWTPTVIVPPDHVVKFYGPWAGGRNVSADELLEREDRSLSLLDRAPDLPVPRIVARGTLAGAWRYLVLSSLPGVPLADVRNAVGRAQMSVVAAWLGSFVRDLHAIPLQDEERRDGWHAFREAIEGRHSNAINMLRDREGLPPHLLEQLVDWLPTVDELVTDVGAARFTHGDLRPSHVLVRPDGSGFTPTGVIDFGKARIGHPYAELAAIWWSTLRADRQLLKPFLSAAALPGATEPGFERLALAWVLIDPSAIRPAGTWLDQVHTLDELAQRSFGAADG